MAKLSHQNIFHLVPGPFPLPHPPENMNFGGALAIIVSEMISVRAKATVTKDSRKERQEVQGSLFCDTLSSYYASEGLSRSELVMKLESHC